MVGNHGGGLSVRLATEGSAMKAAMERMWVSFMDWLCGGPDTRRLRKEMEALDDDISAAMEAEDWDKVIERIDRRQEIFREYIDTIDPDLSGKRDRNRG